PEFLRPVGPPHGEGAAEGDETRHPALAVRRGLGLALLPRHAGTELPAGAEQPHGLGFEAVEVAVLAVRREAVGADGDVGDRSVGPGVESGDGKSEGFAPVTQAELRGDEFLLVEIGSATGCQTGKRELGAGEIAEIRRAESLGNAAVKLPAVVEAVERPQAGRKVVPRSLSA